MTNAITTTKNKHPACPKTGLILPLSKSLDSQALAKHRAMVAVELEVLAKKFDRFGWDRDRGSMAHDRTLTDWMDALQDYPLDEVQSACRAAVLSNPNKMPNEGHVISEIMKARAKAVSRMPLIERSEEKEPPVTPEQMTAILKEAGFTPRRFGGSS